jgi:hypothetical protein
LLAIVNSHDIAFAKATKRFVAQAFACPRRFDVLSMTEPGADSRVVIWGQVGPVSKIARAVRAEPAKSVMLGVKQRMRGR